MNRITINGQSFSVSGSNVSIVNGSVIVGGNTVITGLSGEVHVHWDGPLASLKCDGSVTCQDVQGGVEAGGSVTCITLDLLMLGVPFVQLATQAPLTLVDRFGSTSDRAIAVVKRFFLRDLRDSCAHPSTGWAF